jgi:hypothetical protein
MKITLKELRKVGFRNSENKKSAFKDLSESGLRLHYFPKDKYKFKLWGNMYDAGEIILNSMEEVNIFVNAFKK